MMKDVLNRKFKSFLINRDFQISFLKWSLALAFVVFASIFLAVQSVFWKFREDGERLHIQPGSAYFQIIDRQHTFTNMVFVGVGLGCFLMISIGGMVLSHRVAGPLYRFRRHMLESKTSGHLKPVRFRKKDYFHDLSEAYNEHIQSHTGHQKKVG